MKKNVIQIELFCEFHKVDIQLVRSIIDHGFVEIIQEEDSIYIPSTNIEQLELCVRLSNELGVNLAGLEVINHMRTKMAKLREKLSILEQINKDYINPDQVDLEDDIMDI